MALPARQPINLTHAVGLFVFLVTAALFAGAAVNVVLAGIKDVVDASVAFSYAVAAVAALAMLLDVYDLWVRGRRLHTKTARGVRNVIIIAVLAAIATSLLSRSMTLLVYIGPALILYFAVSRGRSQREAPARAAPGAAPRSSGGAKARQRRGGRKRR